MCKHQLPLRRFRAFRDGDKESDRWCSAYPDHVEVFSHLPDGQPNPEFETADFELAYVVQP